MGVIGSVRSAIENRPSTDEPAPPEPSASGDRHDRYRYLIALVDELDDAVTVDRVVDVMVRWEYGSEGGDLQRTWHDVHEELYQVDLPVLDEAGFVDFDVERGLVIPE